MADREIRTEQQVKDKIKAFNKQRAGLSIVFIIFIGLLMFLPAAEAEALPVRLSVFCSVIFLLCGAAFVISFRDLLLLLIVTTGIPAVLLGLGQIRFELFLILLLTNVGTVFTASITGKAIIRSFTNEIEKINRLTAEATTDALTHLLNRNGLEQTIGIAWALCKRDKKKVGVILADIDYFKSYNDTLGHPEGDNILRQVADSVKSCFRRETDIISRIGGDEFLIFLSEVNDDRILEMAQSLSSSIINLKVTTASENNPGDFLSVSIGVATNTPQPDDLLVDLYKAVDKALYRAKRAGRNCISFHDKLIQIGVPVETSFPVGVLSASTTSGDAEN
ncbi:GGDEF domain-containing protein [Caproiciproducens sp. CPB-2]|uniref:GGDEF domain-containing protein n=1 Tax=Caproiciproducens sp. CPB-2 TaxID=3030017 RepID=UPI0023DC02E7|nr:GGDEF domain-containing protein [Caproiciproducens sp. CPB-2]MDF1494153.1 GGDEF domain-containing protein [Caproiciproducens sp. CPB-2]